MGTNIPWFLILVLLWIGGRFLMRRWLWRNLANGRISKRQAVTIHAASFAIVPLLALPFVSSGWLLLIGLSVALFAFEVGITLLAFRFFDGNPAHQ
jgi:Na+/H+ antiporter NhaC